MQDVLCVPNFWKYLNIIYGTWNFIFSANKVSQINRGDKLSQNAIQKTFSVVNQKIEKMTIDFFNDGR